MKKNIIKALLVEDNPGDARLIKEMLAESKRSTFILTWVDRLSKGIDFIKNNAVDIVLLDLTLPDSSGRETFEKIVRQVPQMPVIILTGMDDEQLAISLLRSGLQDYIVKDTVNTDMLARSIRYAIERKRLEDALRIAHDEMEMRVIQRTMELSEANKALRDEIKQRERAEDELKESKAQAELYVDLMAHDINNMNHIAMGFLELALETIELDPDSEELVKKPVDQLKASSRLIENVRKLQRVKTGEMRQSLIELGPMLSEVVNSHAGIPGSEVKVNYTALDGCYVMANDLLADVFTNLVGNSIKHSDGHVTVNVNLSKETNSSGQACYRISVEDNGPGVPDEMKDKIFNRFRRGETRAHGSGLGLYLVRALLDHYSGKVWVEDRVPGNRSMGSRFVVLLPAADAPEGNKH
ncbi:MAG: hybrid sensor histidine kinase/response regulator [Methanocella sp.]